MAGGRRESHVQLTEDLKRMIIEHCESIPHRSSHYKRKSSNLKYFENPSLNLTQLYKLFGEYYSEKIGAKFTFCKTVKKKKIFNKKNSGK